MFGCSGRKRWSGGWLTRKLGRDLPAVGVDYNEVRGFVIMAEIAEMKALIAAFEKLINNHPELENEMQALFLQELRSIRVKSLERAFA